MAVLDHIGIAIQDKNEVEQLFSRLISRTPFKSEDVESQGIRAHFIDAGSAKLELLESTSPASAVARFLEKRKEGVHHLAFRVKNISATWKKMVQMGYEPLGDGPQPGAGGKLIFFLHPRDTHGMLIEFCQERREPLTPTWIPYEGERLALFELGADNQMPLVILHGAAGCTQMETELLARRLSKRYHVYALDFAAHGKSDLYETKSFTPELFIDNVHAVFERLQLDRANLFGFSLGGFIALAYASRHPRRIHKAAVHATNLIWDESLVESMLERLDYDSIRSKSDELVQYLEEMHGSDRWISLFERMKEYTMGLRDVWGRFQDLERLTVPTLVSAVDKDDLFTIRSPVHLFEKLPDSTLAIIPGQRHALQNADLDLLIPHIRRHFG